MNALQIAVGKMDVTLGGLKSEVASLKTKVLAGAADPGLAGEADSEEAINLPCKSVAEVQDLEGRITQSNRLFKRLVSQ